MAVNVPGLISILIFYILIAVVGIWAGRITRKRKSATASETIIVGARDVGVFVGICTMTATWVGGASINGTAESIYDPYLGLLWGGIGAPAFGIGMVINALFFVGKMRQGNFTTTLDPFQAKLGKYFGIIIFAIDILSGTLYIAAILTALGGTIEVVAGIHRIPAVIVSAAISTLYTVVGGLYSVAFTDVIQFIILTAGLILAVPFALTNDAVSSISETAHMETGWLGTWDSNFTGAYIDLALVLVFGSIPIPELYQRVFAMETTRKAKICCAVSGLISIVLNIPPVLIGAAGASTNWTMTEYMNGSGESPLDLENQRSILPIVLIYLTPPTVAIFGLGAVSAAVMSSTDSLLLAVGSIFGRNIYKKILRTRASEREVVIVIRIFIFLLAVVSSVIALSVNSVVALYYLCVDFLYVLTLPQFVAVLYLDPNAYGAVPAIIPGLVVRLGGGEMFLEWPAPFSYFGGDNFPFRTVAMLSSFITIIILSYVAKFLFQNGYIPDKYDFLHSNLANGGRTMYLKKSGKPREETGNELPELYANKYPEEFSREK